MCNTVHEATAFTLQRESLSHTSLGEARQRAGRTSRSERTLPPWRPSLRHTEITEPLVTALESRRVCTWRRRQVVRVDTQQLWPHFAANLICQEPPLADRHPPECSHVDGVAVQSLINFRHFSFLLRIKVCEQITKRHADRQGQHMGGSNSDWGGGKNLVTAMPHAQKGADMGQAVHTHQDRPGTALLGHPPAACPHPHRLGIQGAPHPTGCPQRFPPTPLLLQPPALSSHPPLRLQPAPFRALVLQLVYSLTQLPAQVSSVSSEQDSLFPPAPRLRAALGHSRPREKSEHFHRQQQPQERT